VPGSAADRLKLQAGDVVLRYDGKPVTQAHLLIRAFAANKGGPARPLVVLRGGKELTLQAPSPLGVAFEDVAQPTR
jgi:serine protease Do